MFPGVESGGHSGASFGLVGCGAVILFMAGFGPPLLYRTRGGGRIVPGCGESGQLVMGRQKMRGRGEWRVESGEWREERKGEQENRTGTDASLRSA